ncbi:MAG: DUF72 domain-containing protein [Candidatus Aminicenantes bacterium]|nr:DUF72 domain-containing protein [Candidatus Aminicenantes bacterium]
MAKYFIGTAGWSYKDWEGIVYPAGKERGFHPLIFLGQFINIIEINSTFYRQPVLRMCLSWVRRVEGFPEFLFAVKLNQVFTHKTQDLSQKDFDDFKTGIEPLRAHERLAAILIQFPWSFANTVANTHYLVNLFERLADYPLALEVRHGSWSDSRFFGILAEHRVCYVNIDQPVIGNSLKPSSIATNPEFAYVRLHGRNYRNWFKQDAGRDARYDYLYTKNELEEWVERIKQLGKKSGKVFVITNNHYRGQAMANALQIRNRITGDKLDIPESLVKEYPILKQLIDRARKGQLDLFSEE